MRELTEYEKEKWFDKYKRFNAPEFLPTGSEPDEAYAALESIVRMRDYGLSDEFVKAAQIECLNIYYYQLAMYVEDWGFDPAEEHGLPPHDLLIEKGMEFGVSTIPFSMDSFTDEHRKLWDWAMEYCAEHKSENEKKRRISRLKEELDRLEAS